MTFQATLASVLAVLLTASTAALATTAYAGDIDDCQKNDLNLRLKACTRVIEAATSSPADKAAAFASRGSAYLTRNQREKAIADHSEAIRINPKPELAQAYLGRLHHANRAYDKAITAFTQALQIDPKNALIYNLRGNSYGALREYDAAISDFTAAISHNARYAVAYSNRATAHRDKGDLDAALFDYNEAIRIDPKYASAHLNRGITSGRKGDRENAFADFNKAIELDPESASAYYNRGVGWTHRNDFDKALADYTTAIRLSPGYAQALTSRGFVHERRKKADLALADYNAAIAAEPDYAHAYSNRANFYASKGDTARALEDFAKVVSLPARGPTELQRLELAREKMARLKQQQSQAPGRHKRVALVIGNSAYAHAGPLPNPSNDAKAIAASFRRLGFGSVIEVQDASREQMGKALKDFGDQAEGAEWAVVFFAGHGIEMNGASYLIPVDAQLKRDTHVDDETVSLTRVLAKVDAASKLGLVILDSCRNNPFLARMVRPGGATRSLAQGLAAVEPEGNVLVAYASRHGTVAADGEGKHSPFTEALLEHMEEAGLEINLVFRKVRDNVRKRTDRRQDPYLYGSLGSEPLYFKTAAR